VEKAQTLRFLTYLAVSSVTVVALAGCGSLASGSPQKTATAHPHAIKRQTVRPEFHSQSLPFALRGYHRTPSGANAPINLQKAFSTTAGSLTVGGMRYTIALAAGAVLMYAPTPRGIVWTVAPGSAQSAIDAGGLYGKIYLTPYGSLSLRGRSLPLLENGQVIYQAPVYRVGKKRYAARLQLYQFGEGALFSQTQPLSSAPQVIRYIAAPFAAVPVTLYSTTVNSGPPALLGPFGNGVLYSTSLPDRNTAMRMIIYNDFSNGQKVKLIPRYSQFTAFTENGTAFVIAGQQTFAIAQNGRLTVSRTPVNPGLQNAQRLLRNASLPYLYLPALARTPNSGQAVTGTLQTTAAGQYRITLYNQANALLCQATVTAQKEQNPVSASVSESTHPNGPFAYALTNHGSPPAIPAFFGKKPAGHAFILQSTEGPLIQWIQSGEQSSGPQLWYASFYLQSWRYSIGPFTSLSNHAQTGMLSQFIQLMIHTGSPSSGAGQVYVQLQRAGATYTYSASEVSFFPASRIHVSLSSPGLRSLRQISGFTLLSP